MATNRDQITFYDIPDKDGHAWSLNPWKTRFALNYKRLPYHTEWTEYPDIAPTLRPHLPPAAPEPSTSAYTIPTIKFPDGTYVMDSKEIAQALEERYPSPQYPSLHLDSPVLAKLEPLVNPGLLGKVVGIFVPGVAKRVLAPASADYFIKTREEAFGMKLDELEKTQGGVGVYTDKIAGQLREVTSLLNETKDKGPFFEGDKVTYADFVWVGFLILMRKADEEGFEKLLEATGDREAHVRLLDGVKPWADDSI
ncbi:hypothetical protein QBC32DRAFT_326372 [Pseudoneurospora amorphoporcata]|uniref:GST N-terminal domain-containing protein n=1 Tax=Pseudoneurospora amorphoporcata TaxID=241081 RepID=A0AAN6NUL7_9PEZI|nr:hypothetical protein QBC32DRAFT_326372 [Pseudoneurospora amorphoporcata]